MARLKTKTALLAGLALLSLSACSSTFRYAEYAFGPRETAPFSYIEKQGHYRQGLYPSIQTTSGYLAPRLSDIYAVNSHRKVIPSNAEVYLTVIPVDFEDYTMEQCGDNVIESIREAFFGDDKFNQYVSLAEYYDKTSFHRLQVRGEVTSRPFRSEETYATLKTKNNASQTKAALVKIHEDAVAWYNAQSFGRVLDETDPVYFVYSAPYSGMDGGTASRSSMMWAFTINEPAPICWSSYFMAHPTANGSMDAHTYIHEFGHMLGLKDYYDQNSYTDLSPCSPLGRMDMMDCSLGEHNPFSKMVLDWTRPYIPTGECEISLRPYSGNGDCVLLPIGDYNGTPYDEYLLIEYYTPGYLNAADATLRPDPMMSLMKKSGVRVYHVDARLGLFSDRAKSPVARLSPEEPIGTNSIDLYCDNSGYARGGTATSRNGFLIQCLRSSGNGQLIENFIAADHDQDILVGTKVAHLRNVLYMKGQGIDGSFQSLGVHKTGASLQYGFEVTAMSATDVKLRCFPLNQQK